MSLTSLLIKSKVDRRIHKSDVFVRHFYEVKWPRIRLAIIAVGVLFAIGLYYALSGH